MSEVITLKCKIEEVFDQCFIELLRMVPRNPYVRALILKITGKMPGQECETFDQIKEWVEMNCEKRKTTSQRRVAGSAEDGISINVDFSETEYGRADYSVPRSGYASFEVSAEDLLEIVREAIEDGEGIDRIVEDIAKKIEDEAWEQCEPEFDNYGEYDYDDHEATDSGNSEKEFSKNEIRNAVLNFIRARHPELAAEL